MQEKTDLDAVKKIAKVLLYSELHKTKMSPIIVSHFFTSSGIADVGENGKIELVDITASEEYLRKWQRKTSRNIEKAKDVQEIFYMVNNPYRLAFLKFTQGYLSREDFSSLLSVGWISAENPHQDPNVSKKELVQMFKEADRMVLMDEDERAVFSRLGNRVTIYRGVTPYDKLPPQIRVGKDIICKPFKKAHEEQLKLVTDFSWIDFSRLANVADVIAEAFAQDKNQEWINEERVQAIQTATEKRIRALQDIAQGESPIEDSVEGDVEENIAEDYIQKM